MIVVREILFRGKRVDNGEWVQGSLFAEGARFEIVRSTCNTVGIEGVEVNPETIGQYTGLNDKNGNKIFEGDIITDRYNAGVVEAEQWNCGCCNEVFGFTCFNVGLSDSEVIGNKTDNPELLKR